MYDSESDECLVVRPELIPGVGTISRGRMAEAIKRLCSACLKDLWLCDICMYEIYHAQGKLLDLLVVKKVESMAAAAYRLQRGGKGGKKERIPKEDSIDISTRGERRGATPVVL